MNRFWPVLGAAVYGWPMFLQFHADAANSGASFRPLHLAPDDPDDGALRWPETAPIVWSASPGVTTTTTVLFLNWRGSSAPLLRVR